MKPHGKDLKDLALLISVIGLGLSSGAAAQTVGDVAAAGKAEEPQRSDWDWVPPDAVAASRAEEERLIAASAEPVATAEPVEVAMRTESPGPSPSPAPVPVAAPVPVSLPVPMPVSNPPSEPALAKSDWDWSPADIPGSVTARVPVVEPDRPSGFDVPADPLYRDSRYTVATLPPMPADSPVVAPFEPVARVAPVAPVAAVAPVRERAPAASLVDALMSGVVTAQHADAEAKTHPVEPQAEVGVDVDVEPPATLHSLPSVDAPAVAARVVVASHSDKVLLSLLSVKAGPDSDWGRLLPSAADVAVERAPATAEARFTPPSGPAVAPAFRPVEAARSAALQVDSPLRVLADPPPFEAPRRIVVATHTDKILLSLASVRSTDSTPMELMALLPQDIAVSKVPLPDSGSTIDRKGWVAVDTHQLDRVRGGFSTPQLQVSFGISRAVYINGSLVTTTSLNFSDVGRATGGMPAAANLPGSLGLVQSGTGNSFMTLPTANGTVATVIQNTLNNQKIQTLTQINATVNSMQILKSMNLQQSLRGAVIDSLRH